MGCASKVIATSFGSRKARRARGSYAGRDTSTSDSESFQEHVAKNIQLDRKKRRSLVYPVPYVTDSSDSPVQVDACTGSYVHASSPTRPEIQNFEDPATPSDKTRLVPALARVFEAVLAEKSNANGLTRFHSEELPAISIEAYLTRISKYFDCSDACVLTSLIYIDRIIKLHPLFPVCHRTIHRLLGVSFMLSAKFHDDIFYSNTYYAKVCGVSVKELNALECEFLRLLSWNCAVSPSEYDEYRSRVLTLG